MDSPLVTAEERERLAHVVVDWDCASCGYDLRGLHVFDACSECGRSVWSSQGGSGVSMPDAAFALRLGILAVALSFTMVGGVLFGAAAVVVGRRTRRDAQRFGGSTIGVRRAVVLGWAGIVLGMLWLVVTIVGLGWMW